MRPLRPSALLLLALLSGCATQPGDSDLEALLARHDYRAALALLDEEADDEPAAELREAARRWRRQQLDQAWQLAGQEEWRHGARVLAEADALLPAELGLTAERLAYTEQDRKSTRLNSSHVAISYAVFCLKKKNANKSTQ